MSGRRPHLWAASKATIAAPRLRAAPGCAERLLRPLPHAAHPRPATALARRNGTPRQPLLVPAARGVLRLAPYVSPDCLEGLTQYSHCWVLYLFHANTSERAGRNDRGCRLAGGSRTRRSWVADCLNTTGLATPQPVDGSDCGSRAPSQGWASGPRTLTLAAAQPAPLLLHNPQPPAQCEKKPLPHPSHVHHQTCPGS
jgi:hypothetical protein